MASILRSIKKKKILMTSKKFKCFTLRKKKVRVLLSVEWHNSVSEIELDIQETK